MKDNDLNHNDLDLSHPVQVTVSQVTNHQITDALVQIYPYLSPYSVLNLLATTYTRVESLTDTVISSFTQILQLTSYVTRAQNNLKGILDSLDRAEFSWPISGMIKRANIN